MVVALLGSGFITVRWQSIYLDIPIHHARPHYLQTPAATLENSGPPVVPATAPAIAAPEIVPAIQTAAMLAFEAIYHIEASDMPALMQPAEFYTLQSLASSIEMGAFYAVESSF